MVDPVFPNNPRWAVTLLMIGACVGAVAVSALFVLLGLIQVVAG